MTESHSRKILVTYASRSGSTIGVADVIGATLRQAGFTVDVLPMSEVQNIMFYDAVVAGSAIRQEHWLPEAMTFMETHSDELRSKPVATFLVCMALASDDEAKYQNGLQLASQWMTPVRTLVNPFSEGFFAGALDLSKVKELRFRILLRALIFAGLFKEGDYRDPDAIAQWANSLVPGIREEFRAIA